VLALASSNGAIAQSTVRDASASITSPDVQSANREPTRATAQPAAVTAALAPAATAENQGSELAEITVTARRRSEDIEHVPVAITAFGSKELEERTITTQSDLQYNVPGLTVRATESQNQLNFAIRGQTIDSFSSSRPGVLTYVDEIQFNSFSASSFYDLDSIQVLKGPQGTLFGRNTTGGAVLFTTAKPTDDFGGYGTVRFGNFNMREVQGAVNLPIVSDKILLRIAGDTDRADGYIRDVYNGLELGSTDRQSGRVTLMISPISALRNTSTFEYDQIGGNNTGGEVYSAYPCGAPAPLASSASCLYSPALDGVTGKGSWAAYLAAHPQANPGGISSSLAAQQAWGPYTVDSAAPSIQREYGFYFANTTIYDVASELQVKNIVGVSNVNTRYVADEVGVPYTISAQELTDPANDSHYNFGNIIGTSEESEELQFLGTTLGGNLTYVGGLYIAEEKDTTFYNETFYDLFPVILPTVATYNFQSVDFTQAIFAQGTYNLGSLTGIDGLSVTGGYRYTWEQTHFEHRSGVFAGSAPQAVSDSKPSWQVGIEDQLNPNLLLYVEQRGSWRSAGFNGGSPPIAATASGGGDEFLPETTYDAEAGLKYTARIWGAPARFNLAVYNQWIKNVQRAENAVLPNGVGIASLTVNVPRAEVTGVELDSAINPRGWLELGASADYTDARYTSPTVVVFDQATTFGPYADTPRFSGTTYAQVKLPTPAELGRMTLRADVYAQAPFYFSNLDYTVTPGTKLPSYALVNFRYDWHDLLGSPLTVSGYVKNALDRHYYVGGLPLGNSIGVNAAVPGTPRMYGVEATYKF
jgi:iron complex outermembrane receptor protein